MCSFACLCVAVCVNRLCYANAKGKASGATDSERAADGNINSERVRAKHDTGDGEPAQEQDIENGADSKRSTGSKHTSTSSTSGGHSSHATHSSKRVNVAPFVQPKGGGARLGVSTQPLLDDAPEPLD